MNKRQAKYWFDVYRTSLRWFGINAKDIKNPTQKSVEKLKKEWQAQTKDIADFPSVREIYKQQTAYEQEQSSYTDTPRDEQLRTETANNMYDISMEIIQSFIDRVEAVYQDTMNEIDRALNKQEGVSKTIAIASHNTDSIARAKSELIAFINQMYTEANNNPEAVAEAIQRNGELDYTIAVTLVPPSDIQIEFEVTLQNLQAIWSQIEAEVRAQAEEYME